MKKGGIVFEFIKNRKLKVYACLLTHCVCLVSLIEATKEKAVKSIDYVGKKEVEPRS